MLDAEQILVINTLICFDKEFDLNFPIIVNDLLEICHRL